MRSAHEQEPLGGTLKAIGTVVSLGLTAAVGAVSLAFASERKHAEAARPKEVKYQGGPHFLDQVLGAAFVLTPVGLTWLITRPLRRSR